MVASFTLSYLKFPNENSIMRNVKMFTYYKLSLEAFIYEKIAIAGGPARWVPGSD
jgi:hypothetical protein